jgi:hypothetical protein
VKVVASVCILTGKTTAGGEMLHGAVDQSLDHFSETLHRARVGRSLGFGSHSNCLVNL